MPWEPKSPNWVSRPDPPERPPLLLLWEGKSYMEGVVGGVSSAFEEELLLNKRRQNGELISEEDRNDEAFF